MNKEEIGLAPITGWDVGPIAQMQAVILRLDYLTHATQRQDEAQTTPKMVMTAALALELSEALKKHAQLAMQATPGAGQPRH